MPPHGRHVDGLACLDGARDDAVGVGGVNARDVAVDEAVVPREVGERRLFAAPEERLDGQQVVAARGGGFEWRAAAALDAFPAHAVEWFKGTTAALLAARCAVLLAVVSVERVTEDAELFLAQMQGRVQVLPVPRAGHALHEDEPGVVAAALAAFIARWSADAGE